jgi:hypothetical protein
MMPGVLANAESVGFDSGGVGCSQGVTVMVTANSTGAVTESDATNGINNALRRSF